MDLPEVKLIGSLAVALVVLAVLAVVAYAAVLRPIDRLALVEQATAVAFDVEEITPQQLAARQATPDSLLYALFDVRQPDEFLRSHLRNAVRIDPGLGLAAFLDAHGDRLAGKHLVFYCSVGYRSSTIVERISAAAYRRGALSVANLRGGIFRWYSEARDVYSIDGSITDDIHHYSDLWGLLISRRQQPE